MTSLNSKTGTPSFVLNGRPFRSVGTSAIRVTPTGKKLAGLIQGANGTSVSKVVDITPMFDMTIPILACSDDDIYLQNIINAGQLEVQQGSVSCMFVLSNGEIRRETYQIFQFIIDDNPEAGMSYSVEDMEGDSFRPFKFTFTGRRNVG